MLGSRIAALRRRRHLSQQELARAISVSASAVGMYEQGRREPPLDRLVALAQLFGVSTDYLLTGVPHTAQDTLAAQDYLRTLRAGLRAARSPGAAAEDGQLRELLDALLDA